MERLKPVYILGDTTLKTLNDYFLTKRWDKNTLSKFNFFQLLKSVAWLIMSHQLYEINPDHIIPHTGTKFEYYRISKTLESDENSIIVSAIMPQFYNLINKVNKVNNPLALMCGQRDISFISHSETIDLSKHLNNSSYTSYHKTLHWISWHELTFQNFRKMLSQHLHWM